MPGNELQVAVLGYGLAGRVFHAPIIESVDGMRVAAVLSRQREAVARDFPGARVVPTLDGILADPSIDLVVVATPNDTHHDFAQHSLMAGKHVVVDKPFTLTVSEAERLAATARATGRVLSVFQSRRWDSDFLTLKKILAAGTLGEIVHFASHYDRYRPEVKARWKEQDGPGGGIWYDLGPHLADQALQLFGMPEGVYADLALQRTGALAVDYFHVLLRYKVTRVVLHGANLVAEPTRRYDVHGRLGSFVKAGMDTQEESSRRGERPGHPDWGLDRCDGVLTTWTGGVPTETVVPTERGRMQDFYSGVRDAIRGVGQNPVPPEDGVAVMRIIEAGLRSAATGAEIRPVQLGN